MSDYEINDPIYDTFIFETLRLLDEIEMMVIESERKGAFKNYINKISRNIHTIKGNSMTLELDDIAKLSHACEDLVCRIRYSETKDIIPAADTMLEYIDYVRIRLDNLNIIGESSYLRILMKINDLMDI
jgi:two-component system, chemotaxis family, sensor kinase CheA